MYYQRGWQDTLIVLDLQPGDTLFYSTRSSGVHELDLLGEPTARAPLRVDGHLLAIEMGRSVPLAIDGVQLWLDGTVNGGLRLGLFEVDGRICPPQALWPRGAAAPPIPLSDVRETPDGWEGSEVWPDGSLWRLRASGSELAWLVHQAEREYALNPALLRWQAERDSRRREGLPIAEMPPLRPQRVGEPTSLVYRGSEPDVLWTCDGHTEHSPYAEIAFSEPGAYAVQLTVARGNVSDTATQWVVVHPQH